MQNTPTKPACTEKNTKDKTTPVHVVLQKMSLKQKKL